MKPYVNPGKAERPAGGRNRHPRVCRVERQIGAVRLPAGYGWSTGPADAYVRSFASARRSMSTPLQGDDSGSARVDFRPIVYSMNISITGEVCGMPEDRPESPNVKLNSLIRHRPMALQRDIDSDRSALAGKENAIDRRRPGSKGGPGPRPRPIRGFVTYRFPLPRPRERRGRSMPGCGGIATGCLASGPFNRDRPDQK